MLTFNLTTEMVLTAIKRGDLDDDLAACREELRAAIDHRILHPTRSTTRASTTRTGAASGRRDVRRK